MNNDSGEPSDLNHIIAFVITLLFMGAVIAGGLYGVVKLIRHLIGG